MALPLPPYHLIHPPNPTTGQGSQQVRAGIWLPRLLALRAQGMSHQGQGTICSLAFCLLEALSQLCPGLSRARTQLLTSILVWIQGPTMLAWLANWRRRCSLDCCLLCSSRRAWSRLGTSCCTWGGAQSRSKSSQGVGPLTWPALALSTGSAHLLPLGVDDLRGDGSVGVAA